MWSRIILDAQKLALDNNLLVCFVHSESTLRPTFVLAVFYAKLWMDIRWNLMATPLKSEWKMKYIILIDCLIYIRATGAKLQYTYCWLSGKLRYLQHNCVGDTIVYHWTINYYIPWLVIDVWLLLVIRCSCWIEQCCAECQRSQPSGDLKLTQTTFIFVASPGYPLSVSALTCWPLGNVALIFFVNTF